MTSELAQMTSERLEMGAESVETIFSYQEMAYAGHLDWPLEPIKGIILWSLTTRDASAQAYRFREHAGFRNAIDHCSCGHPH